MNIELAHGTSTEFDRFGRGERVILVDGVRWGRTRAESQGMHGFRITFHQDAGGEIEGASVRSTSERRALRFGGTYRPTDELVIEKARELIEAKKLRHPDKQRAANDREAARFRERCAREKAERQAQFRRRACEALRINDETSEVVDRVVAAMEWATEQ